MNNKVVESWRYGSTGEKIELEKPPRKWSWRRIACIVAGVMVFIFFTGGIVLGEKCPAEYNGCYYTLDFYFLNVVGFRTDFDHGKLVFPHSKYPDLFGDAPGPDYGFFSPM